MVLLVFIDELRVDSFEATILVCMSKLFISVRYPASFITIPPKYVFPFPFINPPD